MDGSSIGWGDVGSDGAWGSDNVGPVFSMSAANRNLSLVKRFTAELKVATDQYEEQRIENLSSKIRKIAVLMDLAINAPAELLAEAEAASALKPEARSFEQDLLISYFPTRGAVYLSTKEPELWKEFNKVSLTSEDRERLYNGADITAIDQGELFVERVAVLQNRLSKELDMAREKQKPNAAASAAQLILAAE